MSLSTVVFVVHIPDTLTFSETCVVMHCRVATFNPSSALSRTCWLAWEARSGLASPLYTYVSRVHLPTGLTRWFMSAMVDVMFDSSVTIRPKCRLQVLGARGIQIRTTVPDAGVCLAVVPLVSSVCVIVVFVLRRHTDGAQCVHQILVSHGIGVPVTPWRWRRWW